MSDLIDSFNQVYNRNQERKILVEELDCKRRYQKNKKALER